MNQISDPFCHEEVQDFPRVRPRLHRANGRAGAEEFSANSAVHCANGSKFSIRTLVSGLAALVVCAQLTAQIEVASDGKVGIGTASPGQKLTVVGNIQASEGRLWAVHTSQEGGNVVLSNPSKTGTTTSDWVLWNMTGAYGNGLSFWRYFANGTNVGPSVWFGDNGNVGIGITSPSPKLDVQSVSANQLGFQVVAPNSTSQSFGQRVYAGTSSSDYALRILNAADTALLLEVRGDGDVGIGTTNADPTYNRVNGMHITATGSVYARAAGNWDLGMNSSSGTHIAFYTDNGSARVSAGSITSSGSTTSCNTSSDVRLKANIRQLTNSGAVIDALQPRAFDWKTGEKDAVGFVAQELYAAAPYAVTAGDDDPDTISYQWAVDASKLVPVLTAEVKALRVRLAEQERATVGQRDATADLVREIAELRRELAAIKSR